MFIDTHCHIDDEKFSDTDVIVENYLKEKVISVVNMGCNLESSLNGKKLSEIYDSVYFAAGYHPSDVEDFSFEKEIEIEKLCQNPKCVAVGEIGLDYHYEPYDKNKQIDAFIRQIDLAYRNGLPFCVHSRDATLDTLNVLKSNKNKLNNGFIIHCFSGSKETAKEYLDLGGFIGFGGTLTFKNSERIKEVAKFIPKDRILTETDSPYLSPEPFRGKINEPKNIPVIAKYLKNLRGETQDFYIQLKSNAENIFKKLNSKAAL